MSSREDRAYLEKLKKRYRTTGKREKKVILDEFTKTAGYTRKHAIHLLRGTYRHKRIAAIGDGSQTDSALVTLSFFVLKF